MVRRISSPFCSVAILKGNGVILDGVQKPHLHNAVHNKFSQSQKLDKTKCFNLPEQYGISCQHLYKTVILFKDEVLLIFKRYNDFDTADKYIFEYSI